MNNEIKEIIEIFKNITNDYSTNSIFDFEDYEITCLQVKSLLDYITNLQSKIEAYELFDNQKITNLQEENKHLDEVNCHLRKKINNDDFDETMKDIKDNLIARINRQECEIHNLKAKLEMYENGVYYSSENDELQEKIDKAIKFIEEELTFYITIGGTDERKLIGYNKAFDELLKILQGNKWNEVEKAYLDDKPIGSEKE